MLPQFLAHGRMGSKEQPLDASISCSQKRVRERRKQAQNNTASSFSAVTVTPTSQFSHLRTAFTINGKTKEIHNGKI